MIEWSIVLKDGREFVFKYTYDEKNPLEDKTIDWVEGDCYILDLGMEEDEMVHNGFEVYKEDNSFTLVKIKDIQGVTHKEVPNPVSIDKDNIWEVIQ